MSYVYPPYGEPYWYRGPQYGYTFTYPQDMSPKAWECPRCKTMNAPHSQYCKCAHMTATATVEYTCLEGSARTYVAGRK